MLNNFIGGGQIFLHKVRMFVQVLGIVIASLISYPKLNNYDFKAAFSYQKAKIYIGFYEAFNSIKSGSNESFNSADNNTDKLDKSKIKQLKW